MPRPIIFFGSSLNPPTEAHIALIQEMIKSFEGKNPRPVIVVAPVFWHIFSKPDLAQFKPRLVLTQAAFANNPDVVVTDIEKTVFEHFKAEKKSGTPGTVDVLEYLQSHPGLLGAEIDTSHISLMLGEDTYDDFIGGKWKNAEKIINLCQEIHAFGRGEGADPLPRQPNQILDSAQAAVEKDLQQEDKKDAANTRLGKLVVIRTTLSDPKQASKIQRHESLGSTLKKVSSTKIRKDLNELETGTPESVKNMLKTVYSHIYESTSGIEHQRRVEESHKKDPAIKAEIDKRNKNK